MPRLSNKVLVVVFLLNSLPFFSLGQEDNGYMYEQQGTKFGALVRGKVIGFQILEDLLHLNLSSGIEFRFANYHSIGVDYVFMRHRTEEESYDTTTQSYYDNGWSYFDRRSYLHLDYRFYLNFWPEKNSIILPYTSLFVKQGNRSLWYQEGSIFCRKAPYGYKSAFFEYGFALGCHIGFVEGRGGLDINIGAVKNESTILYEDTGSGIVHYSLNQNRWKPHMRLNLYYNLFKI